jgi:hypothetical protein
MAQRSPLRTPADKKNARAAAILSGNCRLLTKAFLRAAFPCILDRRIRDRLKNVREEVHDGPGPAPN